MRSVLDDIDVRAIKTGMLFTAENLRAITSTLREHFKSHGRIPLVCDPVCVSTSGHVLLQSDAVDVIIEELLPLSDVVTPNRAEAELLLKERSLPCKIASLDDMLVAARNLLTFGSEAVLLKGGHVPVSADDIGNVQAPDGTTLDIKPAFLLGENTEILQMGKTTGVTDLIVDVLCQRDVKTITLYPRPRLQSKSTHGTGCTLSAALACALGNGSTGEGFFLPATSVGCSFLIFRSGRSNRASDLVYASRYRDRSTNWERIRSFEPPPLSVDARHSAVSMSFSWTTTCSLECSLQADSRTPIPIDTQVYSEHSQPMEGIRPARFRGSTRQGYPRQSTVYPLYQVRARSYLLCVHVDPYLGSGKTIFT